MDDRTENQISMYLKVQNFLKAFETTLAGNIAIPPLKADFDTMLQNFFDSAADADGAITGYTEMKQRSRDLVKQSCLSVGAALFAYWQYHNIEPKLDERGYTGRPLRRASGATLYTRATQLHQAADPVKALLAPYNCAPADVDALLTRKEQFLDSDEQSYAKRTARAAARKAMLAHLRKGKTLLEALDIHVRTFASGNFNLHHQYLSARSIDNMRGKRKKKKETELPPSP